MPDMGASTEVTAANIKPRTLGPNYNCKKESNENQSGAWCLMWCLAGRCCWSSPAPWLAGAGPAGAGAPPPRTSPQASNIQCQLQGFLEERNLFFAIAQCMKELSLTSWRPFPCNLYNVSLSVEVSRFSVLSRDRLWSSAKEQVFNKQIKVNQGVITDETVHSWRFHNHPQSQHCSFWPRNDSVLSSCQTALSVLSQAASWQSSAFLELWDKMWSLLYSKFPGAEQKS